MNSVNGMYIYLELISISVSSTALYTVSTYNLSITEFTNFYLDITHHHLIRESGKETLHSLQIEHK